MPELDESHDFAHPVESDTAWSESYYFNCYDPQTDSGFFTRIGVRPNEGTIDAGCSFWLPDGGLAGLHHVREQRVMIDDDLVVGPITYERLAALKQWGLTVDGDATPGHSGSRGGESVHVAMDVVFDALTPAYGGDGQGKDAADASSAQTRLSVGKGHLEQAGRWTGGVEGGGGGGVDRGRRCAPHPRARGARQPRQVVGAAAMGRPEDVALVLDQHRR